jgi:hypothetical protein
MAKNNSTMTLPPQSAPPAGLPPVEADALAQKLAAPFDASEVKFKPQHVTGNRALVVPFVDARVIQDRLDEVLGVMGWQDRYKCLPEGSVVCRLRIRLGAEWITKEDVGGQSEQPDEGDRRKAAFSDALKRAAVKFGIGRYLYRLKPQWVDYDPQKRQVVGTPRLPMIATPSAPEPERTPPVEEKSMPVARGKPASGLELKQRLAKKDADLAREGLCKPGELLKHVTAAGVKAGHGEDMTVWVGEAFDMAVKETKTFQDARKPATKQVA